jgi:hypothetical protein
MRGSCRKLIVRYTPYLRAIVVLQKPELVTCDDVTEADSPLALETSEFMCGEFGSLLAQLVG